MKHIAIAEKISRQPQGDFEVKFTIVAPVKDSLERKIYESVIVISDLDLVQQKNSPEMAIIMRQDNARRVFEKFYNDNLLHLPYE